MDTITTCPRGHALEENAVLCTVCWIRVVPEDPEVIAARKRRARRIWIPLFGAGAVLVGVGIGGALEPYIASSTDSAVVMAEAAAVPVEAPATADDSAAVAVEEPVAVEVDPLAATVADPVGADSGACVVTLRNQTVDCVTSGEELALTVCVPDTTATIAVATRSSGEWQPVSSTVTLGQASGCAAGTVAADLVVPASTGSDGNDWRIVSRDDAGAKVWKSPLSVQLG